MFNWDAFHVLGHSAHMNPRILTKQRYVGVQTYEVQTYEQRLSETHADL
jgi:hypothetical protein